MVYLTPIRALIPFYYYRDSQPYTGYAKIYEEDNRFRLRVPQGCVKTLAKREFDHPGSLREGVTLLHNYFYIESPVPPRRINILNVREGEHRNDWAFVIYEITEEE